MSEEKYFGLFPNEKKYFSDGTEDVIAEEIAIEKREKKRAAIVSLLSDSSKWKRESYSYRNEEMYRFTCRNMIVECFPDYLEFTIKSEGKNDYIYIRYPYEYIFISPHGLVDGCDSYFGFYFSKEDVEE